MTPPLGLHTDLYELRMVESYLRHGMTGSSTFSLYARPSPARPWMLAAGADRALDVLDRFRYGPQELDYLRGQGVPDDTLDWLAHFEPSGELWAVADGTVVLGDEPLLELTAPLPVAQLLETALMNVVHFDTLVATKFARCVLAARGRTIVDFGLRRAHGFEAGHRAARAAYLAGAAATSNVEAGRRDGIPIAGTMAHAYVQAYSDEREAFRTFARDHPDRTTLLVDTYDTIRGVQRAIEAMRELAAEGVRVGAVRLDSGDLAVLARAVRARLDAAGFGEVRIFASGGLDEFRIDDLVAAGAPIDAFGVGTAAVVSADRPYLDAVYKLVAYEGEGRAKYSEGKVLLPGPKQVFRVGSPDADVLDRRDAAGAGTPLLAPVWHDGQPLVEPDLEAARARARDQLAVLPAAWRVPPYPDVPPRPRIGAALAALADELEARDLA